MENFRFMITYDGTKYDGWQRQGNTDRTIQGKIEAVLGRLFGVSLEIHGSGRTDSGVHAKGQVANVWIPKTSLQQTKIPFGKEQLQWRQRQKAAYCHALQAYLNQYLPEDICVSSMALAPERFHSRLSAVGKTYCYRICTTQEKPIFERRYVWWLPEQLDIAAMRQAAEHLVGTKDYGSFCGNPKMKKSTVRTVDQLHIIEKQGEWELRIHGDGFLQNMVRIIVGTLVEVGRGNVSSEDIPRILTAKRRGAAGPMAPAQGLCLEQVDYEPPWPECLQKQTEEVRGTEND